MAKSTSVYGFGKTNSNSKIDSKLYCLKPIQRVLDAKTILLEKESDFVVENADIFERHAELMKSSDGWSVRAISDHRYNVLINWEAIEKNTHVNIEEGDLISFRNNYTNCHYSYLYSRHHMYFNELLKIREFFFFTSTLKSPCPIGLTNYADAVEALKENINYLINALYVTKTEVRSLRDAKSVTAPTSSHDVNHLAEIDREIEILKNNHHAEIAKLREEYLALKNEMSLKLKSEIDLKEILVVEKQRIEEQNKRLVILNQNIMEEKERIKEEGENLTSTLLSEGSLLRETVERQQSELSQFTDGNGKWVKSIELHIQNEKKLQADLEFNISQLKREKELQISLRSLLAEEKKGNETLKNENENLKKIEKQNLSAISERTETIEELLRKTKEAEKQLSDVQSLNIKLKEGTSNMKKTLVLNQQVEKRLNENLAIERKRINEEKILNEQMKIRFDQLKKETELFEKEANESRNKVVSLELEVKLLRDTVSKQQTTQIGFEIRLKEKNTELDKSLREISALINKVSELSSKLSQKDAELKSSSNILEDNDTLKKEIGLLRADVVNLKKTLKEKDNEIDDFKEIIIRQNARMEQAISSKNKMTKEYEEIQKQRESKMKNLNTVDDIVRKSALTQTLESNEMLELKEENAQLRKVKESLKEGILEFQRISDEKEANAKEEIRMRAREIEEFHKSRSDTETFFREIKSNLRCPICTEVFEKAVTLNCSHSYCEHCIKNWRRAKDECPTCRSAVEQQIEVSVLNQIVDIVKSTTLEAKSITGLVSEAVTTGIPFVLPHTTRNVGQISLHAADHVVHSAATLPNDLAVAAAATPQAPSRPPYRPMPRRRRRGTNQNASKDSALSKSRVLEYYNII